MYQDYTSPPSFHFSLSRKASARDLEEILRKIDGRAESVARKIGVDKKYAKEIFRSAFDLSSLYRDGESYRIIDDVLSSDRSAARFVAADYRSRPSGGGRGVNKLAVFLGLAALVGGVAYASVASSQNSSEPPPEWHVPEAGEPQPGPSNGGTAGSGSSTTTPGGQATSSVTENEEESKSVRDRLRFGDDVLMNLVKVRPGGGSSSGFSGGSSSSGSSGGSSSGSGGGGGSSGGSEPTGSLPEPVSNEVSIEERLSMTESMYSDLAAAPASDKIDKSFTVYTISSADSTVEVLKKHLTDPEAGNYVYEDTKAKRYPQEFSNEFPFIIGGTSYDEVTTTKFDQAKQWGFSGKDVIVYDIEEWENTPTDEQDDPATAISKTMLAIRNEGYKSGVTPGSEMLKDHYRDIDWSNVDFVGIQYQRYSGDAAKMFEETKPVSDYIKSVNPDAEVFVQVSFRQASNCYDWRHNSIQPIDDPANYGRTQGNEDCVVDAEKSMQRLEGTMRELAKIDSIDGYIVTYMPADETDTPTYPQPTALTHEHLDRILDMLEKVE